MRSKTSFFNATVFWKNAGRFWPVWGSYLVIWILLLPVQLLSRGRDSALSVYAAENTLYNLGAIGGLAVGAIFAVFSAMAVWSYLYNPRSAHGFACLPIRREGMFLSAALSGLLPLLAANAVVALLTALVLAAGGTAAFSAVLGWFGIVSLELLFFYGFAALCAQLTGNIIVLPLVYAVLNLVFVGAETMLRAVFTRFIYGLNNDINAFATKFLSPPVGIAVTMNMHLVQLWTADDAAGSQRPVGYVLESEGWTCLVCYAIAGIALLAGALLLYRARRMETAGDVVAVKPLKPVFRWCMGLGGGLLLGTVLYFLFDLEDAPKNAAFAALLAFLLLGALIGWFAAEMLMKKTFRVFSRRSWAGMGICAVVVIALSLGAKLDVLGIERRVPDAEQVEQVYVTSNGESAILSTPEGVAQAVAFHRQVIENKAWNDEASFGEGISAVYCQFHYTLKDGGTLSRRYFLAYEYKEHSGEPTALHDIAALNDLMNCRDAIEHRKQTGFPITRDNIYHATVEACASAADLAQRLGYDSPEDYILCERSGLDRTAVRGLSPQERVDLLAKEVMGAARYDYDVYSRVYHSGVDEPAQWDEASYDPNDAAAFVAALDWDKVYFSAATVLTPEEAWELYNGCILPDLADGTLGRVWVVGGQEYRDTACAASIFIEAREEIKPDSAAAGAVVPSRVPPATQPGYRSANFYTVPTVDSRRTNDWLARHGVALLTEGEIYNSTDGSKSELP